MERKEAGCDEEKIHGMERRISCHGQNQQYRSKEKQRDRRVERDSLCYRSRVEYIRHAHPDRLCADHIWILPFQLPTGFRRCRFSWRTCPRGEINFPEIGSHRQHKIADRVPVLKIIRPLIQPTRLERDFKGPRSAGRNDESVRQHTSFGWVHDMGSVTQDKGDIITTSSVMRQLKGDIDHLLDRCRVSNFISPGELDVISSKPE